VLTIFDDNNGKVLRSWNGNDGQLQQSYLITNTHTGADEIYKLRFVVALLHDGIWVHDRHNITPYAVDCVTKISEVNELYRYVDLKFIITNPKSCRGTRFGAK
jgi:hypothetical protein